MDSDLLLEVFGFLPQKYFISRMLFKNNRTRISFVDYERFHYLLLKDDEETIWFRERFECQEYGPANFTPDISSWRNKRGFHRINGPALSRKAGTMQTCGRWIMNLGSDGEKWIMFHGTMYIHVPVSLLDYEELCPIVKVWCHDGSPFRIELESGKTIEFGEKSVSVK